VAVLCGCLQTDLRHIISTDDQRVEAVRGVHWKEKSCESVGERWECSSAATKGKNGGRWWRSAKIQVIRAGKSL